MAVLTVAVALLAACGGAQPSGDEPGETDDPPPLEDPPSADPEDADDPHDPDDPGDEPADGPDGGDPDGDVDAEPEPSEATAEPLPGEPTTNRSERDGSWGEDLRVVDVRVGTHEGFDRVSIEVAGDGVPGWWITPEDDPVAQGSGHPIEVAGTTSLIVAVQPVPYPEDGELATPERVAAPDGAVVLTEVVQDSLFEGQHRFVVGLQGPASYVVERLEDPDRVVLDLRPAG